MGAVRNQVGLRVAVLRIRDDNLALLLRIAELDHARNLGDDCETLRLSRLEELLDTRKTLGDIATRDTAGMEGSHGQLRTGLTDRLRRDDTDRLADLHRLAGRHVGAVALRANTVHALAGENRANLDRSSAGLLEDAHHSLGALRRDHAVCLDHDFAGVRIHNVLGDVAAGDSVLQTLDGLLAVHEGLDLHVRDFLALGAVHFADNEILRDIDQTSGQVARVCRTERRIRKSLAGAVCGDKVLQNVESLTEVTRDREFDRVTGRIRHQASHTGELLNLLIGTAGTGVRHHEDVVVLVETFEQILGELLIRLLPGLDNLFVAALIGRETAAEVLADLLHARLRLRDEFLLRRRNRHVGNRNRHAGNRRVLVADRLDVVQHFRRAGEAVHVDDLLENLLALLLLDEEVNLGLQRILRLRAIHKAEILRDDFIEENASGRAVLHFREHGAVRHLLREADLNLGLERNLVVRVGEQRLVRTLEEHSLALCAVALLGQVVDAEHHILRRNRDRAAVRRLQEVVRREHEEAALGLRLDRERQVDCHLVAVEVRVKCGTDERMELDCLALDQNRLEGLDAEAVQRRCAV